jgi:hypothetical protein
MGKFACRCGYVIHDSSYPCVSSGSLLWEPELETASGEINNTVTDFLRAAAGGRKAEWVRSYFGESYPADLSDADVIDDIYSKISHDKGRPVYQCMKCKRLYVRKQGAANEWDCFEKAG